MLLEIDKKKACPWIRQARMHRNLIHVGRTIIIDIIIKVPVHSAKKKASLVWKGSILSDEISVTTTAFRNLNYSNCY